MSSLHEKPYPTHGGCGLHTTSQLLQICVPSTLWHLKFVSIPWYKQFQHSDYHVGEKQLTWWSSPSIINKWSRAHDIVILHCYKVLFYVCICMYLPYLHINVRNHKPSVSCRSVSFGTVIESRDSLNQVSAFLLRSGGVTSLTSSFGMALACNTGFLTRDIETLQH